MSEGNESLQPEAPLSSQEITPFLSELQMLYKEQFDKSSIKKDGKPAKVTRESYTGFGGLGGEELDYNVLTLTLGYPRSTYWHVDQSTPGKVEISRYGAGRLTEVVGLDSQKQTVTYTLLDPDHSNPYIKPEKLIQPKVARNTPLAIDKARNLIRDIPLA